MSTLCINGIEAGLECGSPNCSRCLQTHVYVCEKSEHLALAAAVGRMVE